MKTKTLIQDYAAVGLRLPVNLVREVKVRAAVEGISFRAWMEAAVMDRLKTTKSASEVLKREGLKYTS